MFVSGNLRHGHGMRALKAQQSSEAPRNDP
jgi:hypothetical protein